MQKRTLYGLLSVMVCLALWVGLYEMRGKESREEAAEREKQVLPLADAKGITRIEVDGPKGRVVIERSADAAAEDPQASSWRVREPKDLPADPGTADALAEAIVGLKPGRSMAATGGTDADFGFADGALKVRFEAKDYAGPKAFRIGRANPMDDGRYLKVDGDERLHVVPAWQATALDKSFGDLRDRRVATFAESAATRIHLTSPGGKVALVREGERWLVDGSPRWRAERGHVQGLLSDLGNLRAKEFPDPAAVGDALASPVYVAEVDLGAQGGRLVLQFSAKPGGADAGVYARRAPDGEVVLVPDYVVEALKRPEAEWRTLAVADLNAWMTTEVEATWRGKKLHAKKGEEETWKLELGDAAPVDLASARASDLLRELTDLKAREALAPGAAPPRIELGRFRVVQSNGPEARFTLGKDGDTCLATVDGDPAPLALPDCGFADRLDAWVKDPSGEGTDPTPAGPAPNG